MTNHPNRSPQQAKAIAILREWGKLQRYSGGLWASPDQTIYVGDKPQNWVGTPTVQALYNRRLVEVPEWTQGKHRAKMFAYATDKLIHQEAGR